MHICDVNDLAFNQFIQMVKQLIGYGLSINGNKIVTGIKDNVSAVLLVKRTEDIPSIPFIICCRTESNTYGRFGNKIRLEHNIIELARLT